MGFRHPHQRCAERIGFGHIDGDAGVAAGNIDSVDVEDAALAADRDRHARSERLTVCQRSCHVVPIGAVEQFEVAGHCIGDIGRFGGLAETEGEAIKYRFVTSHDGTPMGPVAIAGPTCDGADIMYEKSNYRLPLALTSGDRVELLSTGAYVTTYASQKFNGFAPLEEHYL